MLSAKNTLISHLQHCQLLRRGESQQGVVALLLTTTKVHNVCNAAHTLDVAQEQVAAPSEEWGLKRHIKRVISVE